MTLCPTWATSSSKLSMFNGQTSLPAKTQDASLSPLPLDLRLSPQLVLSNPTLRLGSQSLASLAPHTTAAMPPTRSRTPLADAGCRIDIPAVAVEVVSDRPLPEEDLDRVAVEVNPRVAGTGVRIAEAPTPVRPPLRIDQIRSQYRSESVLNRSRAPWNLPTTRIVCFRRVPSWPAVALTMSALRLIWAVQFTLHSVSPPVFNCPEVGVRRRDRDHGDADGGDHRRRGDKGLSHRVFAS